VDKKTRRMTPETACKAVDFFFRRPVSGTASALGISFFGGEPFLEPETMQAVIDHVRAHRDGRYVRFSVTTSGVIATPAVERLLRDGPIDLMVSLDGGPEANRPRVFQSGRPTWDVVAKNFSKLQSWAPTTVVRMTFHPQALDLVGQVQAVMALGARTIALCPVVEADWEPHLAELNAAYQALGDWCFDHLVKTRRLPLEVTRHLLSTWHAHLRYGQDRPRKPCGVGTWLLGIDPDGHVMPCHRFLYRPADWLGTVDAPHLARREPYIHTTSADLLGCDTCPARPVCGGGCRIMALAQTGRLDGLHPGHCHTMRAHAAMARRLYDRLLRERPQTLSTLLRGAGATHPALSELA
jgi:uncharacterized protein